MKNIRSNKQKGFTLVELLVVVVIIAILAIIGLTIFSGVQANARDARRKEDVIAINRAIETNRLPGGAFYIDLKKAYFSSGAVPIDSTTAQYCIATAQMGGAALIGVPTTWASTSACPGAPTGYSAITNADLTFTANTNAWRVCARLEASTADTGAGLQVYCQPSAQ